LGEGRTGGFSKGRVKFSRERGARPQRGQDGNHRRSVDENGERGKGKRRTWGKQLYFLHKSKAGWNRRPSRRDTKGGRQWRVDTAYGYEGRGQNTFGEGGEHMSPHAKKVES